MKILMLGWELPPHNSGGLGVACYQLCRALASQGVSIDFALPYSADHGIDFMNIMPSSPLPAAHFAKMAGAYDSYCYRCESHGCDHAVPHDLYSLQRQFADFIDEYAATTDADIIHAHDWLTFEAGMRAKQRTGKPLVAHVHATEFDRSGQSTGNPLVHEIEQNGLLMADHIIAVSGITKDIIVRQYDIPANKIEIAYNAVEPTDYTDDADGSTYAYLQQMKRLGYTVVVSLSRLTVQKGLDHLLYAAQRAIRINPKLLFVLVGDGEQRNELLSLSADLGISQNVLFTGFVRGQQWRDAYTVADIFVMSSVSEPFGLTALEAAGHGNAVLLSRQSGVAEILRSVMKFDFWDHDRLANQIVAIADHPELRQNMAVNVGVEFVRLSWRQTADHVKSLYQRALPTGVTA